MGQAATRLTGAADGLMLLVTLLAGFGWMFSKEALQGLPPLLFLGVRFLLAGLLLAGLGFQQLRDLDGRQWRRAGATGITMALALVCWIHGLHRADHLGVGAFISSLGVVLAPIMGRLLFRAEVTRSTWLALLIAAAGLAGLSLDSDARLAGSDLLFLLAAIGFALHFNLNTRFAGRIPVLALCAVQLCTVGFLALLMSAVTEPWPTALSGEVLGWLLASFLLATSLRFYLQIKAQSLVPLSHGAIIMTLEPVWTALIAMLWLGERMSTQEKVGCGLIFLALVVARFSHRAISSPGSGRLQD